MASWPWRKHWNRRCAMSGEIPMPVSRTTRCTRRDGLWLLVVPVLVEAESASRLARPNWSCSPAAGSLRARTASTAPSSSMCPPSAGSWLRLWRMCAARSAGSRLEVPRAAGPASPSAAASSSSAPTWMEGGALWHAAPSGPYQQGMACGRLPVLPATQGVPASDSAPLLAGRGAGRGPVTCASPSSILTSTATSPCSVNLTALDSRLASTWRRRMGSASTACVAASSSIAYDSASPLRSASGATISMHASTVVRRLTGSRCSSIAPWSSLQKSRMSPRMDSRLLPDSRMVSASSRCSGVSADASSSCAVAIMPLSGVRISWLMLARNMDLASVAVSAATLASSSRRSSSLRRMSSVTSLCTPMYDTSRPPSSNTGVSDSRFQNSSPFFL
mmetsp:Transcript_30580/g.78029  ORF Transcript_30580/g.78029 Transcript_30580/m.78029 type:complete len:390 (-) Transcript_30580:1641-2810(-)